MTDDDVQNFANAARQEVEKVTNSDIFISLFSPSVPADPICMMHFGLAVFLDKPIYVMVLPGVAVPTTVRRIARIDAEDVIDALDFAERGEFLGRCAVGLQRHRAFEP